MVKIDLQLRYNKSKTMWYRNVEVGMKKILVSSVITMIMIVLVACGGKPKPNDYDWKVTAFEAIDQDGQPFRTEQMKGKIWLVNFAFTSCTTVCPPMTFNLTEIQQKLKEKGIEDVHILSFSVDPSIDTPAKIKEFLGKYKADTTHWRFVTGYSQAAIEKYSLEMFKSQVQKVEGDDQVIHTTSVFLVDQEGTVLTRYNGLEPPEDKIVEDVKSLLE